MNIPEKKEGEIVKFDTFEIPQELVGFYVYVERRIPMELENATHALIDEFLTKHNVPECKW